MGAADRLWLVAPGFVRSVGVGGFSRRSSVDVQLGFSGGADRGGSDFGAEQLVLVQEVLEVAEG